MQSISTTGCNLAYVTSIDVTDREAKNVHHLLEYSSSEGAFKRGSRLTIAIEGALPGHRGDAAISTNELIVMDAYNAG